MERKKLEKRENMGAFFEFRKMLWATLAIKEKLSKYMPFLLSSIYIRRKYWICENFRLPVFDGFTCFEMS